MLDNGHISLNSSIEIMNMLSPHWNKMKAIVAVSSGSRQQFTNNTRNINVDDKLGVSIYLGNYSDLDKLNNIEDIDLDDKLVSDYVIYPDAYNKLSPVNKRKLLGFLVGYRGKFNDIISKSTHTIMENLKNTKQNQQLFKNSVTKNLNISNDVSDTLVNGYSNIFKSFNKINNHDNLQETISWVCGCYVPTVISVNNKLKLSNASDTSKYTQYIIQNPRSSPIPIISNVFALDGVNNNFKRPIIQKMTGGDVNNTPEPTIVYRDVPVEKYIYMSGGSSNSIETYISLLINGQKEFNTEFASIYKSLANEYLRLEPSDVTVKTSKAFNIIYALSGISISRAKTSAFISGFYAKKNWNGQYTKYVSTTIDIIKQSTFETFKGRILELLEQLRDLLISSNAKANTALSSYMGASKQTSEIISSINKVTKISCNLSIEEINRYKENLRRLMNTFTHVTNESKVYNAEMHIDTYLKNIDSRAKIIEEYYRFESNKLKYQQTKQGDNSTILSTQLNEQLKTCLLYINETIDAKLTEYRLKNIENNNISDEIIKKIESAYSVFRNVGKNEDVKKILDDISKILSFDNRGGKYSSYDLINKIQRLWKLSGYVDYIVRLYTDLGIFGSDFNWGAFKSNVLLMLTLVNITVSPIMLIEDKEMPISTWYNSYVTTKFANDMGDPKDINTYNIMMELLLSGKLDDKVIIKPAGAAPTDVQTAVGAVGAVYDAGIITILYNKLDITHSKNLFIQLVTGKLIPVDFLTKFEENFMTPVAGGPYNEFGSIVKTSTQNKYCFDITPYNNPRDEYTLVNSIMEAMITNIMDIVSKYMSIKYTGTFNLPIQVSTLMRGGNMDGDDDDDLNPSGGKIFDILPIKNETFDQYITEATPFYICGFNLMLFYYKKYNKEDDKDLNKTQLYFNIPSISPLYPLTDIFKQYGIEEIGKLTYTQLKTGIGVFNKYWKQSTGTGDEKLSFAIDLLLNEVNGCMIYTSKLQYESLLSTGKFSNNFMQSLSSNMANLKQSLTEAMSSAVVNLTLDNESQAKIFESMMQSAQKEISRVSEENKISKLQQILMNQAGASSSLSDYYKFMELCITPLVTTLETYHKIFNLYEYSEFSNDNNHGKIASLDLKDRYISTFTDEYDNTVGTGGNKLTTLSVWDAIQVIYDDDDNTKDYMGSKWQMAFFDSTVILEWNTIIIAKTIQDTFESGVYRTPMLWYAINVDTYPKVPSITYKVAPNITHSDNFTTLREIYPHVNGKTLYDYYVTTLLEFNGDIECHIRSILSYPGIPDKLIKSCTSLLKKQASDMETLDKSNRDMMTKISMSIPGAYIAPPAYPNNYILRQYPMEKYLLPSVYTCDRLSEQINLNQNLTKFKLINYSIICVSSTKRVENTPEYMTVQYTWFDWVIYMVSRCDALNGCIPISLLSRIQNDSIFAKYSLELIYDQSLKGFVYDMVGSNAYLNPITGNIITRSGSAKNATMSDYNTMNKAWIANIVSTLPFVINKINAYNNSISYDVKSPVDGDVVKQMVSHLLVVLVSFFNEISVYMPPIKFMSSPVELDTSVNYHPLCEILSLVSDDNNNVTSSDYLKLEWANKYFFTAIDKMIFPDFKNFDRFVDLKEYMQDKLSDSLFCNSFDNVLKILGKNACANIIITKHFKNEKTQIFGEFQNIMQLLMNITADLHPAVAQTFINNVLYSQKFGKGTGEKTVIDTKMTGGAYVGTIYTPVFLPNIPVGTDPNTIGKLDAVRIFVSLIGNLVDLSAFLLLKDNINALNEFTLYDSICSSNDILNNTTTYLLKTTFDDKSYKIPSGYISSNVYNREACRIASVQYIKTFPNYSVSNAPHYRCEEYLYPLSIDAIDVNNIKVDGNTFTKQLYSVDIDIDMKYYKALYGTTIGQVLNSFVDEDDTKLFGLHGDYIEGGVTYHISMVFNGVESRDIRTKITNAGTIDLKSIFDTDSVMHADVYNLLVSTWFDHIGDFDVDITNVTIGTAAMPGLVLTLGVNIDDIDNAYHAGNVQATKTCRSGGATYFSAQQLLCYIYLYSLDKVTGGTKHFDAIYTTDVNRNDMRQRLEELVTHLCTLYINLKRTPIHELFGNMSRKTFFTMTICCGRFKPYYLCVGLDKIYANNPEKYDTNANIYLNGLLVSLNNRNIFGYMKYNEASTISFGNYRKPNGINNAAHNINNNLCEVIRIVDNPGGNALIAPNGIRHALMRISIDPVVIHVCKHLLDLIGDYNVSYALNHIINPQIEIRSSTSFNGGDLRIIIQNRPTSYYYKYTNGKLGDTVLLQALYNGMIDDNSILANQYRQYNMCIFNSDTAAAGAAEVTSVIYPFDKTEPKLVIPTRDDNDINNEIDNAVEDEGTHKHRIFHDVLKDTTDKLNKNVITNIYKIIFEESKLQLDPMLKELQDSKNTGFSSGLSGGSTRYVGGEIMDIYNSPIENHTFHQASNALVREFLANIFNNYGVTSMHPHDIYTKMYPDKPDNSMKKIYDGLFKQQMVVGGNTNIFALIINYFHKYTVSFNSIYNQVLFPGVLFNSSIFRTIMKEYKNIVGDAIVKGDKYTGFIKKYLQLCGSDTYNILDVNTNMLTQTPLAASTKRDTNYTFKNIIDLLAGSRSDEHSIYSILSNIYTMPTVNNDFISSIVNDDNFTKRMSPFAATSLLGSIRKADIITTYTTMLMTLVKYVSYYDIESGVDVPFSGIPSPEPFSTIDM